MVERFGLRIDQRHERRSREVYAGDAAVIADRRPARAAIFGWSEFVFVAARLADEVGFECFQTLGSDGDVAVEENGFIYESLYLDFGHGNKNRLRFLAALAPAHLLQNSRDTKALHPVFCCLGSRPVSLSAVFSKASQTFFPDLRIFLTGFSAPVFAQASQARRGSPGPVSFDEVAMTAGL